MSTLLNNPAYYQSTTPCQVDSAIQPVPEIIDTLIPKPEQKKNQPQTPLYRVYNRLNHGQQRLANLKNDLEYYQQKLQQKKQEKMMIQAQIKYICQLSNLSYSAFKLNPENVSMVQKLKQVLQQINYIKHYTNKNIQQESKLTQVIRKLKKKLKNIYKVINLRA